MKYSLALLTWAASTASAFTLLPGSAPQTSTQLNGISPGVTSKTGDWELNKIAPITRIEGQSRHTFSFTDEAKELVQIAMHSPNGRPIDSDIELWIGPDWTPVKINCHTEDGQTYPIQTVVGTRNRVSNVELLNTGPYAYPIDAACSYAVAPLTEDRESIKEEEGVYVEGRAIKSEPLPANVDQVQVLVQTEGKLLNCVVELLNGPNNVKVDYEVFTNNGVLNSLFVVFDTPAAGNTIRIRNLATMEYPCKFYVKPTKFGKADTEPLWN